MTTAPALAPILVTEDLNQLTSVRFMDRAWINAKVLKVCCPDRLRNASCYSKPSQMKDKLSIPETDYVYAAHNNKTLSWAKCAADHKQSQLLISLAWLTDNFFRKTEKPYKRARAQTATLVSTTRYVTASLAPSATSTIADFHEQIESSLPSPLPTRPEPNDIEPELVLLEDHEKFYGSDGEIIEIETRGTKTQDGLLFKLTDVATSFNLPNLRQTVHDKSGSFKYNKHYKTFNFGPLTPNRLHPLFNTSRTTYLTYSGMIKVLMDENANMFNAWAERVLYVAQMGNQDERVTLAANIVGVSVRDFKATMARHAGEVSGVYLMKLGTVAECREFLSIPDSVTDLDEEGNAKLVCKFGRSKNLPIRAGQNERKYRPIGSSITIVTYAIIDPTKLGKAETEIKHFFADFGKLLPDPLLDDDADEPISVTRFTPSTPTPVSGRTEIVVITKNELARAKDSIYASVGAKYANTSMAVQIEAARTMQLMIEARHADQLAHKDERAALEKVIEKSRTDLEKKNLEFTYIKDVYEHAMRMSAEHMRITTENYELKLTVANTQTQTAIRELQYTKNELDRLK